MLRSNLCINRYISEDFGGVALHPIDLLDASTGRQVAQLTDPNLETICPVNKPHPRQDIIVSGSSRSLYAWKPTPQGTCTWYAGSCRSCWHKRYTLYFVAGCYLVDLPISAVHLLTATVLALGQVCTLYPNS